MKDYTFENILIFNKYVVIIKDLKKKEHAFELVPKNQLIFFGKFFLFMHQGSSFHKRLFYHLLLLL